MESHENKTNVSKKSKLFLLFGFAFFINPVPLGFDILPDVFGCALIYFGLTQLAYFDGSAEAARKSISYLFIVELIKLFTMKSVMLAEISSNRMLFVTVFSIAQGLLYIMFFKQLFDGISYFSARNNCNEALNKCDGILFLSNLAFFVRIAATLVPELWALIEMRIYVETDFDIVDSLSDIVSAKPIVIILLSLISLVTCIAWYISISKLIRIFYAEGGDILEQRYNSEYTSKPEKSIPRRLRAGSIIIYIALFFAVDFVLDEIRIIPASGMFIVLYISSFFFNSLSPFGRTRIYSLPAFICLLGAEAFHAYFVPYGAVAIYETELWIVAVGAVISLIAFPCCLLCVRGFLADLRNLSSNLGGSNISTTSAWVWYCISIVLRTFGYAVPYLNTYVSSARFIAACVFIYQTAKLLSFINEEERERAIMSE